MKPVEQFDLFTPGGTVIAAPHQLDPIRNGARLPPPRDQAHPEHHNHTAEKQVLHV